MAIVTPDIVVPFGPRGILSLVGIVVLVAGVWYVDRVWDEKGSAAYERVPRRIQQNLILLMAGQMRLLRW
jgi:hypothetical protein